MCERERFERWITTEGEYDPVDMVTEPGGDLYALAGVQEAWNAWQGCLDKSAEQDRIDAAVCAQAVLDLRAKLLHLIKHEGMANDQFTKEMYGITTNALFAASRIVEASK